MHQTPWQQQFLLCAAGTGHIPRHAVAWLDMTDRKLVADPPFHR